MEEGGWDDAADQAKVGPNPAARLCHALHELVLGVARWKGTATMLASRHHLLVLCCLTASGAAHKIASARYEWEAASREAY